MSEQTTTFSIYCITNISVFSPEPCVPMNLSVHYNVSTAQVMWAAARGASSYSVQAVADLGSGVTCNTNNTTCSMNGLQCGQIYNVTVMARNTVCDSMISETSRLMTGSSSHRERHVNIFTV